MSLYRKCFIVFVSICSFALAHPKTTVVELTQERRPEVGWVVTCSWSLAPDDHLQAVFLHRDDRQFVHYRPDHNGASLHHSYSTIDDVMDLTCDERAANCTLVIELMQPPRNDIEIACEVSGEGPMFRMGKKSLTIDHTVLPSDAVIEASKASDSDPNSGGKPLLNCSSTGIPAPRIEWTIGDENSEMTSFHNSRVWNATSKLWYSWSTLMVSDQLPIKCTPKVLRGSKVYSGKTAQYNAGSRIGTTWILRATSTILAASLILFR
ncbi:uncharacterized protein LOC128674258 [Plodia interpunctella]|uniref:uncharacterized protein LOC128674258 n=1 Tax=Plodia interpunctella TaxID=58824 RepID=UPI002368E3AA|nr:uncharacterized protein LOC128674258 [Plodia interpunctella]